MGMQAASAAWQSKSPEEQKEYSLRVAPPDEQGAHVPGHIDVGEPPPTPWGIGDASFPLTPTLLDSINVRTSSKLFCAEFGPIVREGGPVHISTRRTCEEKFGPGACEQDLLPGMAGRVASVKSLLDLLSRADQAQSDILRLYWFLPRPVALKPDGFIALLCSVKLSLGQQRAALALLQVDPTSDAALQRGFCCRV
jgi:hypothetical protein